MKRNEPVGGHSAHLFRDRAVSDGESATSLCGRRTSYGPFAELSRDAADDPPEWLCGLCVRIWTGDAYEDEADREADHDAGDV